VTNIYDDVQGLLSLKLNPSPLLFPRYYIVRGLNHGGHSPQGGRGEIPKVFGVGVHPNPSKFWFSIPFRISDLAEN